MAYIPRNAEWYLADVVMEFRIAAEPRSVVHVNTLLVHACSPDEAYEKAVELGREAESKYPNTDGAEVTVVFRGLQDLNVIHDALGHGTELAYSEKVGMSDEEIAGLVKDKPQLGAFAEWEVKNGPNYMPQNIADQLRRAGVSDVQLRGDPASVPDSM